MLLGLRVAVLLGHAEINNMNNIGCFAAGTSNKEVVGFDISVDQVLLMNSLHAGELDMLAAIDLGYIERRTICLATMTTVLMVNRRLQWSKRSSRLGPRRSITRML